MSAAARAGDRALEVDVRRLVFMDQLTAGRVEEAFAELPALIERVEALRQVRFAWYPPMWRAMHALATGDLDGAAHFIDDVREVGRRSRYADVAQVYALQTFLLHRARGGGGLAEVVPDAFHAAAALARGRWEVFWAALAAATGDSAEARTHLDVVLADRSRLGGERVLPAAVALLTDAVELLGDARAAAVLHGELRPWRGQFALVGSGAALLGPVDHYLDRLAAVAGDAIDH